MLVQAKKRKKQRILLVYITKVSGHRQATLAIRTSIKSINPDADVPCVNGFGYTYPILEKVVHKSYMGVVRTTPKVWDYMYDNPKVIKKTGAAKRFLHKASHKKLARLIERHKPDAVVCTQAFPCGMFGDFKKSHNYSFKVIGVLTDFAPHSFWINDGIDYFVVPSSESRDRFVKKGIHPDKIKVYGIPINTKYANQLDRNPIAEKLGLDSSLPTILIMGGGQGLGPIRQIVKSLRKVKIDFQIIVIAGTNKKLIKWINTTKKKSKKKILVYEVAKNVDELMELSDLIITKPGGMTTAECLAKGLPMVIVNPLPGQEMRNTDFLLKKGIGIRVDKSSDIGEEIELLLKSPERLAVMGKAAFENGKPYAALNIAKLALDYPKNGNITYSDGRELAFPDIEELQYSEHAEY